MINTDTLEPGPRSCPYCGAVYNVRPSWVKEKRGYTCSLRCNRKWRSDHAKKKPVGPCIAQPCDYIGPLESGKHCRKHDMRLRTHGTTDLVYKRPPPLNLAPEDCAWVAACLDCEGWIGIMRAQKIGRFSYFARLGVGNTNRKLCDTLLDLTKCGNITFSKRNYPNKDLYMWNVHRREQLDALLLAVRGRLILKQEQADILLDLPPKNARAVKEREQAYVRLKALNKKGRR